MKDLEDKYARMLRRIDGEDPELTAWDMLEDESLPFTERVKAYPMPEFHEMDRSRTSGKHHDYGHPTISMEERRLPLRCATRVCHR
jgi:hypothetical protein